MKPLSQKELACLYWASIGKTSWEAGKILGLSERTVNFHIQAACRKLGVYRRQAAITTALRAGWLNRPGLPTQLVERRAETPRPPASERPTPGP